MKLIRVDKTNEQNYKKWYVYFCDYHKAVLVKMLKSRFLEETKTAVVDTLLQQYSDIV